MDERELSGAGRMALGAACVACCTVPMVVVLGLVSVGAFVRGGVAVGSVVLVGSFAVAVRQRRVGPTSQWMRMVIGAVGTVLSGTGLALLANQSDAGRPFVAAGLAVLACAGMLAIPRKCHENELVIAK